MVSSLLVAKSLLLKPFFAQRDGPVFPEWFSGAIRIPRGELVNYIHGGFASVYERDEYLEFQEGVLIDQWINENTLDEAPSPITRLRFGVRAAFGLCTRSYSKATQ
jgi:hypothetical protein